jgi:predicted dienelactone hydrolase
MRLLLIAMAGIALLAAAPLAAEPGEPAQVVTQQASADDPGHQPIPLVIWTPSQRAAGVPLVVLSHGTGAGPLSHVDTAKALAEAGFVVVAPMHPGDNFEDDSAVGKPAWFVDRSRHLSRVIGFMLERWSGHSSIDSKRIGTFGFSAGATTALIALGGELDLTSVGPHCATSPEFVCKIIRQTEDTEPPVWTHDARVRAAVIAAPGLGFAFKPESLAAVDVPVQLWGGSADETVPYASNTARVQKALPGPLDFHDVPDAVHLSFLSPCTAESPRFLCQDKPGFDRVAFHERFNRAVVAFFQRSLASDPRAREGQ